MKDLASVLADVRRERVAARGKINRIVDKVLLAVGMQPKAADEKYDGWEDMDKLLSDLVSLAGIQPEQYEGFCRAVDNCLRVVSYSSPLRSLVFDEALLEAERRLRSAQDAIMALSEEQRGRIGLGMHEGDWTEWTRRIPKMLESIAEFTGSAPYRPNEPSRRGPKRERSHLALRKLVRDLWSIAQAHGGDFTLWADRGGAKGTMVEALHLLKPVLPPGFVPHVIPHTTLNRLRPDHNYAK